MGRQWVETLEKDLRDLRSDIKHLARDVSLKPNELLEHRVFEELRALLSHGLELSGFIRALDTADRAFITRTMKRSSFTTREARYAQALTNARLIHADDSVIIRELATCLTATQETLHERSAIAVWEGVRHLLKELERLESGLAHLRIHLSMSSL